MADETPIPTELVYVTEPSWQPALAAMGLALMLAGLFVWFPYGVAGALIVISAVVSMVKGTSADVERLPRRQKLTTTVLPAVPPRKPSA